MSQPDPSAAIEQLTGELSARYPNAEARVSTPPAPNAPASVAQPASKPAGGEENTADSGPAKGPDTLVHELVFALLLWEASAEHAQAGLFALTSTFADHNELRVAFASEIAAALPSDTPRREERAERLHAALNDIFRRESGLNLSRLSVGGKRDARTYLLSIEGVPPFAAARTALMGLGSHAIPIDARVLGVLTAGGVLEAGTPLADASAKLERLVKSADSKRIYALLECAASDAPPPDPVSATAAGVAAASTAKTSRSRSAGAAKRSPRSRKTA